MLYINKKFCFTLSNILNKIDSVIKNTIRLLILNFGIYKLIL